MTKQAEEHMTQELAELSDATRRLCKLHASLGLDYPKTTAFSNKPTIPASIEKRHIPISKKRPHPPTPQEKKPAFSAQDIATLRDTISHCERCISADKRPTPLFGTGKEEAPTLLIVGDVINDEGTKQKQVFPGQEGELLVKMLAAIDLAVQDVFQANIIRCVLDSKEVSLQSQVQNCRPHLIEQIKLMRPAVICTMGQISSQAVLGTKNKLIALRGRFQQFEGIPLMATYHPSQLLQVPDLKKAAWYDLQLIQNKIKQLQKG